MAALAAFRRSEILARASALIQERRDEFARTNRGRGGQALKYARAEVDRGAQTFLIAAEEASASLAKPFPWMPCRGVRGTWFFPAPARGRRGGHRALQFSAQPRAHKVAPALAAGNAVVLKPASSTPITSVKLCEVLAPGWPASGWSELGRGWREHGGANGWSPTRASPRSPSPEARGWAKNHRRGRIKKITLELGNTSPVVIARRCRSRIRPPSAVPWARSTILARFACRSSASTASASL